MLKKVRIIDYGADYAYAPPDKEAVINLLEIISIVSINKENTRRPFDDQVRIRFNDGSRLDILGKPEDFLVETTKNFCDQ
jgi:hypothetical protein